MQVKPQYIQGQQQVQKQKLVLTQQLQQSIQVLAHSSEELCRFIEQRSLENPLLELDMQERDQYITKQWTKQEEEGDWLAQLSENKTTLYDSLVEQIHLNYRNSAIRQAMLVLVQYIDSNGYLSVDLDHLASTSQADPLVYLDALTLLQQLEPAGIGARNLQECLLLQIERDEHSPALAYIVIEEEFENFANRHWEAITQRYDISLAEVQQISDYILTLTPHPGAIFQETKEIFIIPDLSLQRDAFGLHLYLNKGSLPKIHFAQSYYEVLSSENAEVKQFAQAKKNEVEWLQRSLHQRNDTIFSIAQEIIRCQHAFFEEEDHPLVPLTLKEVASALHIHESTVSRAVNGKYMETWFGIFELKSFFVQVVKQDAVGKLTQKQVQQELRKLINDEDKKKPLSDQKLSEHLQQQGLDFSRRTVAKYRKELGIPTASKRKRFDG